MAKETDQHAAAAAELSALLDRRRDELENIDGVVGTGVGLTSDDKPARVVIQILVQSPSLVGEVEQQVAALLGKATPIETVFWPTPAGDEGQHGGGN